MAERYPLLGVEQDPQDDNSKTTYAFNKNMSMDSAPFVALPQCNHNYLRENLLHAARINCIVWPKIEKQAKLFNGYSYKSNTAINLFKKLIN